MAGCLGEASTRHTCRCQSTNGYIERKPEISTPFAGANRSRFEGLRRTALSALWGAPLLLLK